MNKLSEDQLRSLAPEARLLYAIGEMKKAKAISEDEARALRMKISTNDQSIRLILSLTKDRCKLEDLENFIQAHIQNQKEMEKETEEYSPNTRQMIKQVEDDTSPLGNVLVMKKKAREKNLESNTGEFSLNLLGGLE